MYIYADMYVHIYVCTRVNIYAFTLIYIDVEVDVFTEKTMISTS